jgi:SWI/SNF-related matrix-associated actin-dependent regulator 1 of chromatin subfamily A
MGVHIREIGDKFHISFKYLPAFVEMVKAIPGRSFNHEDKSWSVPVAQRDAVRAFANRTHATWGDQKHEFKAPQVFAPAPMPELDIDIDSLMWSKKHNGGLFDYQKRGVAYNLLHKRVIVGDTMGLGKTSQAIATAEAAGPGAWLIICPSSLKINWQREIEDWTRHKALILADQIKHNFHYYYQEGFVKYFIVNYESLKKYFVEKINMPKDAKQFRLNYVEFKKQISMFKGVIIDESHRIKSGRTWQTRFSRGICKDKEYRLLLTGTPVVNKPKDLIQQLAAIGRMPELFDYSTFMNRYCAGPKEASNLKELNSVLTQHCFYRRDKQEVLKDLPAKTRTVVITDITTRKEYNDAMRDLEKYLREYKGCSDDQIKKKMRGEIMVTIGILKNISARGKVEAFCDLIESTLEQGEKLIVFANLHEIIDQVTAKFPKCVSITGKHSTEERQRAVDLFQNDPTTKLIVCSIKAAGVGITLTASSQVAFIELPWTFADCEQSEDRAHRVGQKNNVTCTYLLGDKTIDQKIYQIILEKKSIAQAVTGAEDVVEENVVSQLIDLFNQEEE